MVTMVIVLGGAASAAWAEVEPRSARSVVDRPVPILLLPVFFWLGLCAALATTRPRLDWAGWFEEFLGLLWEFGWVLVVMVGMFSVRAYRTWRRDRADGRAADAGA